MQDDLIVAVPAMLDFSTNCQKAPTLIKRTSSNKTDLSLKLKEDNLLHCGHCHNKFSPGQRSPDSSQLRCAIYLDGSLSLQRNVEEALVLVFVVFCRELILLTRLIPDEEAQSVYLALKC